VVEPTRLILVRHGESRATVDQIAGGARGCRGLSPLGVRQAEALRDRWAASEEFRSTTALLSSTLPRAVETAQILAPALGCDAVVQDVDLCEMEPGEGDGLSWEEFNERYGSFSIAEEPYRPLSPGGESWFEFQLRVGRALHRVVTDHDGGLVVVACHGGVINGSLRLFLDMPGIVPRPPLTSVANTSITEWVCRREPGLPLHWQLVRYNDHAHLGLDDQPWPQPAF
jgi:probable phosphoglycerate mutase